MLADQKLADQMLADQKLSDQKLTDQKYNYMCDECEQWSSSFK